MQLHDQRDRRNLVRNPPVSRPPDAEREAPGERHFLKKPAFDLAGKLRKLSKA
jgi:hypothetical protein